MHRFDLSNKDEIYQFKVYCEMVLQRRSKIEIQTNTLKRTNQQNKGLHKFFVIISDALNEIGQEFCYTGLKGLDLSVRYSPYIVKEFFWRPIQIALYNIESTTKLNTEQINGVADVIIKFFGDKGVVVEFPHKKEK